VFLLYWKSAPNNAREGRWILENYDFQRWCNDQQSRLLWVKGDPGKGKTMLLCGIINELEKSMSKTGILSYFFCQATDSRINHAIAVLRGLLYLLLKFLASLGKTLAGVWLPCGFGYLSNTSFEFIVNCVLDMTCKLVELLVC
jgi:DNA replication protein DnaC